MNPEVGPVHTAVVAQFQRLMDINVFGTFLCTKVETAAMIEQELKGDGVRATRGVVVNMGSCAGLSALPNLIQYTTSKHAVQGLTKSAGECRAIRAHSDVLFHIFLGSIIVWTLSKSTDFPMLQVFGNTILAL